MGIPKWLTKQVDAICEACVCPVKGRVSGFDWRAYAPKDNEWGCWLAEIAPEQMELVRQGPDDGSLIFDPVDIDLQALPSLFTELESFLYDPGSPDEEAHLTLCGKIGKRNLVVLIFFQPFEDATVRTVIDVNNQGAGCREKRGS